MGQLTRFPRIALWVSLLLVLASCESSDSSPASSATTSPSTTQASPPTTTSLPQIPEFEDDGMVLSVDDAVRIGTLDNGLTYYVRENDSPGGRAQLRLAVKAGSIQEDPAQRGVAHFLEHMAFNGTERFPANELVLLLQRFGAEFGPDINAYTSYEETVYELELPTENPATVESGFAVLAQWAAGIALDPTEVDLERGVLVEEWRLRDQNFWGRYFTGVTEILLDATDYDDRTPLATPEEVAATTRAGLADFYDRWYRPDTMAVIAVGDFDADEIQDLIEAEFAAIEARGDTPPVPSPTTEAADEPTFFILADPEYPQAWAELNYPLPAIAEPATVGSIRIGMALELAWGVIVARLDEQSRRSDTPFFDPSFAANPLVRGQRSPGLAAFADPADLGAATEALLLEVRRAELHGFGESELARATAEQRSAIELAYDERSTTQDAEYADRYVEHYLGQSPIPSAEQWRDLRLRLLDEMTPSVVWDTFRATLAPTEPFVIIVAPEGAGDAIPTEEALRRIVDRTEGADVDPWIETADSITTLIEAPDPAGVTDRGRFSDTGLTVLTLDNGTRVVFLPTTIRDDVVVVRAASPGGWAIVEPEDAAEAQLAADVVTNSGLAGFDRVDLDRFFADINADVRPFIGETTEGLFGEASIGDVEPLLQLLRLYMTEPGFDQRALDVVIAENLPFAADVALVPDLAVGTALADARFDDPRFRPLPPSDELENLDLQAMERTYRDRFDDPGDFVFAFVGDFDQERLEDLVRRYLGTIPGPGDADPFVDVRPDPPAGVTEVVVQAGSGVLGGLTFLYSAPVELDSRTRIEVDLLRLVIQQRLTERIREQLSASYSPFAAPVLVEDAEQSVEFRIQISGDPEGLDDVADATLDVLADLRDNGPTADELDIAAEQLRRDYELLSNEGLGEAILFSALHPDELLSQVTVRIDQTDDPTAAEIQELATELLPEDRYILVKLVPA